MESFTKKISPIPAHTNHLLKIYFIQLTHLTLSNTTRKEIILVSDFLD